MTIPQIQPEEVYALVVGIEKYKAGPDWDLNGPGNDAIKFTNWLLERGVKSDNIFLFISPLEDNRDLLQKTKVKSKPASREEISDAIAYNLLEQDAAGRLLYIFWGGHGFITKSDQKKRILLFSDTDPKNYKNLDFYSLQEAMETSFNQKGFARQVYLVDACANPVSNDHFEIAKWEKTGQRFVSNSDQQKNEQFILFAAAEYEVAINDTMKEAGSFSNVIWNELNKLPSGCLLPDLNKLAEDIKTTLKKEGKPQPIKLYFRDWDGNQGFESFGFRQFDWREFFREMMRPDREIPSTNRLTSTIAGIAPRVKDIYVPLGLVERKKQSKRQNDVSPKQGSELYKEIEITKQFEHNEFLKEVLKQNNSPKSKGKRIAIIGEPGAGKTTLLQCIADWVYNEIEQSVVIWVSLASLQGQELETYLYEKWPTAAARKKGKAEAPENLKDDFATEFTKGRVWLLLDGLDEMSLALSNPLSEALSNLLSEIARQIRKSGSISQARIVLTCRVNLWDGSSNALNEFDTYRTLDFSYPQQVEQFIEQWFRSNAQEEQGQRLCHALNEQGKERIRDLVKNPLRLTLLCFNWSLSEGKLPETKAELYKQFVTDLYELKSKEFPTSQKEREELNAKLTELSRKAIDKEKNRFLLRHEFVYHFLGHPDEKGSSFNLALKLGWLNKVGLDAERPREAVYAFFHPTFEEYFAALDVNDWDFFLPRAHKNKPVKDKGKTKRYRIFEPQWKEVILLWLGREDKKLREQKEEFIQVLEEFEDGCGDFYVYRAYILAREGIAEFRDYSRAERIVWEIVHVVWDLSGASFTIMDELWAVLLKTERTIATTILENAIEDGNVLSPERVADTLLKIHPGNSRAIRRLVSLIRNCVHDLDFISTFLKILDQNVSLGNISSGDRTVVIEALTEAISNPRYYESSLVLAAAILGRIDPGSSLAIEVLEHSAENSPYESTRITAAEKLWDICSGNSTSIRVLRSLIQNSRDEYIRRQAAESLLRIDPDDFSAFQALEQLTQNSPSELERCLSAEIILRINPDDSSAIQALEQLIQNSPDEFVCRRVKQILLKSNQNNSILLEASDRLSQISQEAISNNIYILVEYIRQHRNEEEISVYADEERADQAQWTLEEILPEAQMPNFITTLRDYLPDETNPWECEFYYHCDSVLGRCAQTLPYPTFYQAWHHPQLTPPS